MLYKYDIAQYDALKWISYLQPGAVCFVNGRKIEGPVVLKTGSRVILGKNHVFRFNHPEQGKVITKLYTEWQ